MAPLGGGSSIFSGRWSKTQNGDQNQIYPYLRLQYFTLFKGVLKNGEIHFKRKCVYVFSSIQHIIDIFADIIVKFGIINSDKY